MAELLTASQLAERWGCTRFWVNSLIRRKKLRAEKVGGIYMIKVKDADSYEHQPGGRPSSNGHTSSAKRKSQTGKPASRDKSRSKAGRKANPRAVT